MNRIWPGGRVIYSIDPDVPEVIKANFLAAATEYSALTCLAFIERTIEEDYVGIKNPIIRYCNSEGVGYVPGGYSAYPRANYCSSRGFLLHMIGHVIGLYDEQTRPDRDNYVRINYENIIPGYGFKEAYFDKRSDEEVNAEISEYDYGSIMQFSKDAFSVNGNPTIEITNQNAYEAQGSPQVGQRDHLSQRDIESIRLLYGC